jgi:predicted RNA-binding Zn ribbon-like protein
MDFPAILKLNCDIAVSLVNNLTPGEARGSSFELPSDPAERRELALQIPVVEGERRVVDKLTSESTEGLIELAGLLREVFEADSIDAAGGLVNEMLQRYAAAPILVREEDAAWRLHFHSPLAGPAVARGAGAASALAVLIDMGHFDRVGVCEARRCDRVYFDETRNARKRFCSSACNNRTKMAMFRERQNSGAAA